VCNSSEGGSETLNTDAREPPLHLPLTVSHPFDWVSGPLPWLNSSPPPLSSSLSYAVHLLCVSLNEILSEFLLLLALRVVTASMVEWEAVLAAESATAATLNGDGETTVAHKAATFVLLLLLLPQCEEVECMEFGLD